VSAVQARRKSAVPASSPRAAASLIGRHLAEYNDAAIQLAHTLLPGTYGWGAFVNSAASMA
jgi:hypothetical protein